MPDLTPRHLLDVAIEAAYVAGRRTLAYFNTAVRIDTKADDTPVTIADREAEQLIRAVIHRHFPTHSIVGEEQGRTDGDPDCAWYVDPIDGTRSFVHGIPLYSVLIACEIRGNVEAGVIYLPALDEMIAAASGLGCTWNGRKAQVSGTSSLDQALLLCTDVKMARQRGVAYDRLEAATRLQRGAFDAYGYALVATGRADVVIDPVMSSWDCGPLPVILREAGGRFSDWRGLETIHGGDALATNGLLHEAVLKLVG
ncbi:MAG: histidinol phosphate phosphatase [Phycisphaerae bacterium]|nr:histidinol phosphate phosphatase [Phycisphaerae bacterium]MDW8262820.1 inositol monophosphatase family protein [Phycisphaerales bacterium]